MNFKEKLKKFNELRSEHYSNLKRAIEEGQFDEDASAKAEALETLEKIRGEMDELAKLIEEIDEPADEGGEGEEGRGFNPFSTMTTRSLGSMNFSGRGNQNMNSNIIAEKRDFFKKFVEARAAGNTTSMADVIPESIMSNYAIEKAPGAFFEGASKTNIANSGTLKLPVASLQSISAHTENAAITPSGYVPNVLEISHSEYAYNTGYSSLGVEIGAAGFMGIIENVLLGSMLKKFDGLCIDAVAALTYVKDTNAVEYANGSAPEYADFVKLAGLLGADFVGGAKWYMAPSTYFNLVAGLVDDSGKPILDASKKVEDNALLGYGFELDAQVADGVIYFGDSSRVHFNAAKQVELNRWTDFDTNTEKAGVRCVVGAACEAGAFVKMYEAAAT